METELSVDPHSVFKSLKLRGKVFPESTRVRNEERRDRRERDNDGVGSERIPNSYET